MIQRAEDVQVEPVLQGRMSLSPDDRVILVV